ncbi:MAG: heavy-metal-associated domain-containing protein [Deltaproteobacteria bacterium]|nr:heavy-metal-associated domain-containing protein [Deltaproteobacteria bacterium]
MSAVLNLTVDGMTCGGCASSVRRVLAEDEAVLEVLEVNVAERRAASRWDEARLGRARLAQRVEDAGFSVSG